MKPFPPLPDLPNFVGEVFDNVSLARYVVVFAFESGLLIYCDHRIEHVEPAGARVDYNCVAEGSSPLALQRLLGRTIRSVHRQDYALTLIVDGGAALTIFSEEGPYESGAISGGQLPLIVF